MALITVEKLNFKYPLEVQGALKDVSLTIEQGEFIVIAGPSGCGKSTLLKILKPELTPHGEKSGIYLFDHKSESEDFTKRIGYVFQNPDNQIVSETVRSELIFGMENYGLYTDEMRIRLAEIVELFDLNELLDKNVNHLSGGQKQLLNLAAIMLLQPEVILLDEPTAQLDPIAARELLSFVKRINDEFGITIILVEHRLEEAIGLADKLILMEAGSIKYQGKPREVLQKVWLLKDLQFIPFIPSLTRIFLNHSEMSGEGILPITIKEAKQILKKGFVQFSICDKDAVGYTDRRNLFECKNLHYKYERNAQSILKNLDFIAKESTIVTIFGSNGAGKSTFLKLLAGIYQPLVGKVLIDGKKVKKNDLHAYTGYLPQQSHLFFIRDTIGEELEAVKQELQNVDELSEMLLNRLNLKEIMRKHPQDCSGGEIQKAALACVLLKQPKILLLDEPTKGLDPLSKMELGSLLEQLRESGTTIIMVSHDIEFAAEYSDECSLMFEGEIVVTATAKAFFKNNFYFTPSLERLKRFQKDV